MTPPTRPQPLDPRDPDLLTVEEHVDSIMRRYGRALDALGDDRLVCFREQRRQRRWGCSVVLLGLALFWFLVAYGVTRL